MMVSAGLAEWATRDSTKIMIFWRRPSEWADLIFAWAASNGHTDSIMTMYEFKEVTTASGLALFSLQNDTS